MFSLLDMCRVLVQDGSWNLKWVYLSGVILSAALGIVICGVVGYLCKRAKLSYSRWIILGCFLMLYGCWWLAMFDDWMTSSTALVLVLLSGAFVYLLWCRKMKLSIKIFCVSLMLTIVIFLSILAGFLCGERLYEERIGIHRGYETLLCLMAHNMDYKLTRQRIIDTIEKHEQSSWRKWATFDYSIMHIKKCCQYLGEEEATNKMK